MSASKVRRTSWHYPKYIAYQNLLFHGDLVSYHKAERWFKAKEWNEIWLNQDSNRIYVSPDILYHNAGFSVDLVKDFLYGDAQNMLMGRKMETARLLQAAEKEDAQMIAVYGRWRVGKTYLIRETFRGRFLFQHAGVYQGTKKEQLRAFYQSLLDAGLSQSHVVPNNWMEAFQLLKVVIQASTQQKKIIFIDELA